MKRFAIIFFPWLLLAFAVIGFVAGCASTKGIKTLADMGKDASYHDEIVQGETQRFEKVREAIEKGDVEPGMSASEFVETYGQPVIAMQQSGQTAYIYKHGDSTWFSQKKIHLYFDETMKLVSWKCDKSICSR